MILKCRSAILAMRELRVGLGYRGPDAIKHRYFVLPSLEDDDSNSQEGSQMSAVHDNGLLVDCKYRLQASCVLVHLGVPDLNL